MKEEALFATNTSSIPLETLALDLQHPERLVGLHFFNPVAKMQLVEVVSTTSSSEESIRKAIQFTKGIGKLPLPVRSSPGFLVNRILMPYLHEAAILESEGIPAAAIDRAAEAFGMPIGPIELIDMVGLDICQSVVAFMGEEKGVKMPGSFQTLLQQGRLGKKTGTGYYTYANNKPQKEKPGKNYQPPADLTDRLVLRLINESVACLREEVVSDGDLLDAGLVYGTGFAPFRGGVIHYVKQQSGAVLQGRLAQLQQRYGDRFRPDPGWDQFM
jgi:3-hydroxyacyl-CoA dehydrogenase/enoyl-CoA hydratase/3-hydroxybutyryl-CoA epimerase